mgnify:CR=1 FL=1
MGKTINSNSDYFVYGTNYTQNILGKDDDAIKMNLNPNTWINTQVHIMKGIHSYPAEIAEWSSVKSLVNAFAITISPSGNGEARQEDIKAVNEAKNAKALEKNELAELERRNLKAKKLKELGDRLVEKAVMENGKDE